MSFVELDDVIELNERLLSTVLGAAGVEVPSPIPRLPYDDAIARFGTDRPDTRFGLEIADLTDHLRETEFKTFGGTIADGGVVRGLNGGKRELSRGELDGLVSEAQELGAKGLVWAVVEDGGWRSPVAKFLSEAEIAGINETLGAGEGEVLLLVADRAPQAAAVLGALRERLGERWGLIADGEHAFTWIVDWPLVEWNEEEQRWDALHHPFTSPDGELDAENPGEARALAYDVVWNGNEIGGGSIRISHRETQLKLLEVLGISADEAESRFGFLLEALRYGAPPHGGIAYGLDRIVAILHNTDSIRDVIAFPKTASGADPLTGAPAPVDDEQLRDLGLALRKKGKGS
jgi:aspartyl-tRNA synthetase